MNFFSARRSPPPSTSSRRRRELVYHNLRVAYMSLTKNTILVRSRLLYVYHRRPAHRRVVSRLRRAKRAPLLLALSSPSRDFRGKSREGERRRTKKGDRSRCKTARGANMKLGRRKFDSTASHENNPSVINILSLKFKSQSFKVPS